MAYDEELAARIRAIVGRRSGVSEKKMFGGLAFLVRGNMFCGVVGSDLMMRVGPDAYEAALARLSEERRTAVILRVEFGYSHAQVAEATGAPSTDAARMTVTRGLQELRAALREPEAP